MRARSSRRLEAPAADTVTWDNFVVPLEEATERLGRAWGVVNHLNHVMDTPELRATYNENQPKVTEFWTELGQNEALFDKYKQLRASAGLREPDAGAQAHRRERPARLPPGRRRAAGKAEGTLRRDPGRAGDAVHALLGKRAGRHQRLQAAGRGRSRTGRPAGRRQGRRPRRGRARRQDGLAVQPALPVLLPGAAVRRQPRTARADLPRQRHQGLRDGRGVLRSREVGQHRQHRPAPEAARRGSQAARLPELRRTSRSSRRWPRRRNT